MKFKVLGGLFIVLSIVLFSTCSSDENDCVVEEVYDSMENNPAREVPWIIDLIESSKGSASIGLYEMDGENYYVTTLASQDRLKSIVADQDQATIYIYDSEGEIYCVDPSLSLHPSCDDFHVKATFVATIWHRQTCGTLDQNVVY